MSRIPALKMISIILTLVAVLSVSGGMLASLTEDDLPVRIGAAGGGLLSAWILWAFSGLISGALAIASPAFLAQGIPTRSNAASWTPASSRPPASSPSTGMTSV